MSYTDLIARLREFKYNLPSEVVQMKYDAADAIEALVKERDELAEKLEDCECECDVRAVATRAKVEELSALRKQIDELEPAAWHFSGKPLYLLDGIKK